MKNFWYISQIMNHVLVVLLVWISTLLNASSAVGMLFILYPDGKNQGNKCICGKQFYWLWAC